MPTLRQQCKERFKVAFDSVRVVSGSMSFILVVDEKALLFLSDTIKMMDLINYGITSVEKLELKRKRFKKIEAVYLVHPDNYGLLLDDFPEGQEPQYHSIHVLFLCKIPPYIMTELGNNMGFVKRLKTLKELNFNFDLFSHNQARLLPLSVDSFSLPLLTQSTEKYQTCIANTVEELATVLTVISSFYIVEVLYNKSNLNNFAQKVALGLKEKLQQCFKVFERDGVPNYNSGAPPTTFLILDRIIDPVSPLVRDYHYGPLLYDFKDIKNHVCCITKENKEKKNFHLDENDEIMQKYQNQHFATTLTGLQKDFENFSQNHSGAKFEKNANQQVSMDKIAEVISLMPKYTESKDRYGFHIEILSDMYQFYEKSKLKEQGELEQTIVLGGVTQGGKKLKSEEVLNQVFAFCGNKSIKPEEKAKLLLQSVMCLDLKTKERSSVFQCLEGCSKYATSQRSLPYLLGSSIIQLTHKKQKSTLILDRHQTKLEEIIKDVTNGGQGGMKFLRIGGGTSISKTINKVASNIGMGSIGRKKIGVESKQTNINKPRLIIFVSSCIGYNEIRSIQSEYDSKYQLFFVSHNFLTQNQYLKMMANVEKQTENQDEL